MTSPSHYMSSFKLNDGQSTTLISLSYYSCYYRLSKVLTSPIHYSNSLSLCNGVPEALTSSPYYTSSSRLSDGQSTVLISPSHYSNSFNLSDGHCTGLASLSHHSTYSRKNNGLFRAATLLLTRKESRLLCQLSEVHEFNQPCMGIQPIHRANAAA